MLGLLLATVTCSTAYLQFGLGPQLSRVQSTVSELRCLQVAMTDREGSLRTWAATGDAAPLAQQRAAAARVEDCGRSLVAGASGVPDGSLVTMLVQSALWGRVWSAADAPAAATPTTAQLRPLLADDSTAFERYRQAQDTAIKQALASRDSLLRRQDLLVRGTGAVVASLVMGVLVVDLRRRRRLERLVDEPVQGLVTTMDRVLRGELGVQPPELDVPELARLGEGIGALARRLEREQAQGMLREESALRHGSRLQVVLGVARATAGSPSPHQVAQTVAAAAIELGRVSAVVWLEEREGEAFVPVLPESSTAPVPEGAPPGPVQRAAVEARSVRQGDRASFPLVVAGRVVGVLDVLDEAWDDEDSAQVDSVLEALARFAAVALQSARLHAQTLEQARGDALTGLRNRHSLDAELPVEFTRSRRYDRPLSVALLDVDHFKRVNDTAGHAVGDAWLRLVGGIVLDGLRTSDSAYRYGGEELVVVLPETDLDAAVLVAERLREAVAACAGPKAYPTVTVSIGVATVNHAMAGYEDVLAAADAALYAAKRSGRNRVVHSGEVVEALPV
ncbi:diguanylate cyclase (GGDEF)-like protein [Motilibacter rhizosphaerae]|uniref:Diguanylate cyclase (GGDEF)-like protein n=1 Tax=Motilibacter rhizosphaerae TaxID=598652 RepID=A0A4Q7NWR4_9ACTN|nr:diguanylate cyclase (GGDEF)-like protein [Motilibacter rhizosphaerae]